MLPEGSTSMHQGQCAVVRETETEVCQTHKFPGNLKKYLPKKADCMVSYKYNSFQVDMVDFCLDT